MFERGDVLVPKETPAGPAEAREAWADALGQLLVVESTAPGVVVVNCPAEGASYSRDLGDVAMEYERSAGDPDGRSWAATITRCATEAARVDPDEYGGRDAARYWERVAAAIIKAGETEPLSFVTAS